MGSEHLGAEVDDTIASSLRTDERAAPAETLAREDAGELVAETLVLTEEVADLTTADTDVASRNVSIGTDVALELGHEALAEAHDLSIGLAFGVEIGAALATAHREGCEAILENLLESEELEDTEVNGGVETETALVGADSGVHLNAEAAVDLDVAFVVEPGHAEDDGALGLCHALKDLSGLVLRVLIDVGHEGGNDLAYCLMELRLVGVLGNNLAHELLNFCFNVCHNCSFIVLLSPILC